MTKIKADHHPKDRVVCVSVPGFRAYHNVKLTRIINRIPVMVDYAFERSRQSVRSRRQKASFLESFSLSTTMTTSSMRRDKGGKRDVPYKEE